MALCSIEDIEVASEHDFNEHDTPRIQYLIDSTSAFICNYIGQLYGMVRTEEYMARADGIGSIDLPAPVVTVTFNEVLTWAQGPSYHAFWDGLDKIWNLNPYGVVYLTVTYGTMNVPYDLRQVCIQSILETLGGADLDQLREYTVGDLTYKYEVSATNFNSLQMETLKSYRGDGQSVYL